MLERLILIVLVCIAAERAYTAEGASARIIVQQAPLAGFVYYDGKDVWDQIRIGDRVSLVREARNPHDPGAVRLEWNGHMLGYVPRKENSDLARQMDHGAPVEARITDLRRAANGRHRISYEIYVTLK
ncbi:MAG: HIRAN domain-containing protein [Burkholderiales bacterium]